MIIQTRRRLLRALDALAETGEPPPGADEPAAYDLIRSGTLMLPADANWLEEVEKVKVSIAEAR